MKQYIQVILMKIVIIFLMTPVVMLALGWEQASLKNRIIATIIVVIGLVVYDKLNSRSFEIVADAHRKHPNATIQLPVRADWKSAGHDVFSPESFTLQPNEQRLVWLDIKTCMQHNEVAIENVRSSHGKVRVRLANTQGWIDASYYNNEENDGNIGVYLSNEGNEPFDVAVGDRIAQIMFQKYLVADNTNVLNKNRKGGFGSSGK